MQTLNRGLVFEKLRAALKARGLTYKDLGDALDLSEPTIKRLFQEKDCKISRLLDICRVMNISLDDILKNDPRQELPSHPMPLEVERVLGENDSLFAVLIHLNEGLTLSEIATHYDVGFSSIFLYARDLEKLGILDILPNNEVRLKIARPLAWHPNGPLFSQIKKTNMAFLKWVMERATQDDTTFISISRTMRPETAVLLQKELNDLRDRFNQLAREDKLLYPSSSLIGFKWATGFSATPFDRLLKIDRYPHIQKEKAPV